tara:strand:+ start:467 stop:685 length:219 start_codon:yes stop_codon:yes gene_type:complete
MSAKEKYNPIDYQLSVAKNMISDLQSFIQKYQGKAYMLGDSVYFESREQMDTSKFKLNQIIEQLQRVKSDLR